MKKVRFVTPFADLGMSDSECHSPRPFIEMKTMPAEPCNQFPKVLPFSNDPIQRFECSNSSPYPTVNKTCFASPENEFGWKPSDDLDLSLLDASIHEPREATFSKSSLKNKPQNIGLTTDYLEPKKTQILSSIENIPAPPNVLVKDSSFFIRRDNLNKFQFNVNPLHNQFQHLSRNKENDPMVRKAEIMKTGFQQIPPRMSSHNEPVVSPIIKSNKEPIKPTIFMKPALEDHCRCHHCVKTPELTAPLIHKKTHNQNIPLFYKQNHICATRSNSGHRHCHCNRQPNVCSHCTLEPPLLQQHLPRTCSCQNDNSSEPQNAVDKKTWTIQKFEQKNQSECMEVEKQANVSKEKREPTVSDLFKIIKLQNEQLQLLQEKVDKFISTSKQNPPTISCSTQHVTVSENEQVKMSIGVMTSFEMVHTSTIINKEVIKQTNENAQIQCNRSHINIKEVVSKPVNLNFLDGIMPVNNPPDNHNQQTSDTGNDKTLNELSLFNVQVDNATTPNLSPEQTLYLDVRDYSESDASSNDRSNVGWTYYNKVMTHVNGMLQDSEMPSSASAMFRNMRQQCVQIQIDKPNISVTKRVKFGDDPLGIHQPHIYASDTSLKMNQLAAKYLNAPVAPQWAIQSKPTQPIDMSFATRNYMEKHRLLQGVPSSSKPPQVGEIPRFLDITALKQQPKFL